MVQRFPIYPLPPSSTTSLLSASATRGYICCNWWSYTDILLSPRVRSLHSGSVLVLCILWIWTIVSCYVSLDVALHTVFWLCAPPSIPPPTPVDHWSFYCLHSFTFSRMSYSSNHTVCSLFRLTFLLNMHVGFICIFSWFHSSFLFSAD